MASPPQGGGNGDQRGSHCPHPAGIHGARDQRGSRRGDEKWSDVESVLDVEMTGLLMGAAGSGRGRRADRAALVPRWSSPGEEAARWAPGALLPATPRGKAHVLSPGFKARTAWARPPHPSPSCCPLGHMLGTSQARLLTVPLVSAHRLPLLSHPDTPPPTSVFQLPRQGPDKTPPLPRSLPGYSSFFRNPALTRSSRLALGTPCPHRR